jgi:5-methylcytosine-specific restriction endonuclease McrA
VPYMKNGKRDYRREYDKYAGRPDIIKKRDAQNAAHNAMEVKLGHPIHQDVDHIKPISKGGTNAPSNLRVLSPSKNRSFRRDAKSRIVSQTSKREAARKGK